MSHDDDDAAAAALCGVPGLGPVRLRILLDHHDPVDALERLSSRRPLHPMVERTIGMALPEIRAKAAAASPAAAAAACERAGVSILRRAGDAFPAALVADPEAPAVLFARGDPTVLERRRVGIVGTRNATSSGLATAGDLGESLAAAGITVVSGLARGIDGAAHAGVRRAGGSGGAAAVVGNGPDRPYPRRHAALWEWVVTEGLLVSEWPPGTPPDAWRFPLRNRILAALCEVLVVVESRERGGSLITARAAADRGVEVMAVPGSPRSVASCGTNRLLVDGAAPVTAVDDVLVMLGLDHRRVGDARFDPRPMPTGLGATVLDAVGDEPCTLGTVVERCGLAVTDAALALARLERDGWLVEAAGWFERAGSRLERR